MNCPRYNYPGGEEGSFDEYNKLKWYQSAIYDSGEAAYSLQLAFHFMINLHTFTPATWLAIDGPGEAPTALRSGRYNGVEYNGDHDRAGISAHSHQHSWYIRNGPMKWDITSAMWPSADDVHFELSFAHAVLPLPLIFRTVTCSQRILRHLTIDIIESNQSEPKTHGCSIPMAIEDCETKGLTGLEFLTEDSSQLYSVFRNLNTFSASFKLDDTHLSTLITLGQLLGAAQDLTHLHLVLDFRGQDHEEYSRVVSQIFSATKWPLLRRADFSEEYSFVGDVLAFLANHKACLKELRSRPKWLQQITPLIHEARCNFKLDGIRLGDLTLPEQQIAESWALGGRANSLRKGSQTIFSPIAWKKSWTSFREYRLECHALLEDCETLLESYRPGDVRCYRTIGEER